jgi:VanZ family protein
LKKPGADPDITFEQRSEEAGTSFAKHFRLFHMIQFLKNWTPPVLWAVFISYFSTDTFSFVKTASFFDPFLHWIFPAFSAEGREWIHEAVRKLAHWTEFFVFAFLLARAFRSSTSFSLRTRWVLWTLLITGFYASADEIHQLFVPSRSGSFKDSLLDLFGGCCAVLTIFFLSKNPDGGQQS